MSKTHYNKGHLKAIIALLTLVISTTLFFIPIFIIGLAKLFPKQSWRVKCTNLIDKIIAYWIDVNNTYMNLTQSVRWQIQGMDRIPLNPQDWNLVIANHQNWLDIILLQRLFNRKIPILKFFIKDQLKWVPLLGFAWWAMGSPFMKRYSKEYLSKNPHKKGQDLLATRKALKIFKQTPSTIMNFIEGTRFTEEKKSLQNSPYNNLLKPRAGGISFVISAMGEKIDHILDVTLVYPGKPSLWDFLCHRIEAIAIDVRRIPIPKQFINQPQLNSVDTQHEFREWVNELWAQKDSLITHLKSSLQRSINEQTPNSHIEEAEAMGRTNG